MKSPSHNLKTVELSTDELCMFHKNPRVGNVETITESLKVNGQYRPIVVNVGTLTGRPLEVLAGNHTLAAALSLGWKTIQATTVDVDDEHASRIVLADNRTSDLASYDDLKLHELLTEVPDLSGTGFSDEYVGWLASSLEAPTLEVLAEEYGPLLEDDHLETIRLDVEKSTANLWAAYRSERESDDEALIELMQARGD